MLFLRALRSTPLPWLLFATAVACQSGSEDDSPGGAGMAAGASAGTSGAVGGSSGTGASSGTGGSAASGGSAGGSATGGNMAGGSGGSGANGGGSGATGGGTGGTEFGAGGTGAGGSANGGDGAAAAGSGGTSAGGTTGGGGAGATGGAPSDPCATALFCDDFESYSGKLGGPWTTRANSGAVALDTSMHVSGKQSVKFTTQAASSVTAYMRFQDTSLLPTSDNVLYGRMLFRLESAPTASVHWTIIQGFGLVPGQTYHAEYRYGGQMPITQGSTFVGSQMMANYDTPDWYSDKSTPGSDCWHHSNARVIPVGTWTCIEWKFDGANNGMQLWLDGVAADDLTIAGHGDGCVNAASDFTWTAPSFTAIDLGWESYQTDDARTAYIDDVALSTTRIGCPAN